jgi:PIN domain nuclease of toxin-antitoxin system
MAGRAEAVDLLLDTCALLWLALAPERLSSAAQSALAADEVQVFVSSFTAFEIAVKQKKGKLELPAPAEVWFPKALSSLGIEEIPMRGDIALAAVALPFEHGDPGDRIVIATARLHGLAIVTADHSIRGFEGCEVVW